MFSPFLVYISIVLEFDALFVVTDVVEEAKEEVVESLPVDE